MRRSTPASPTSAPPRRCCASKVPVDAFAAAHSLQELAFIGPASERLILEYVERGESPTIERAIDGSGKRDQIEAAHRFRSNFLSRAGALQILMAPMPGVIGREDYLGDLQMHTEWSDGAEAIENMAAAARHRRYTYIGVSDHSRGLPIAGGMSLEQCLRQHERIDRLNREWNGAFRVIKGIEANIPAAGGVDLEPDELALFEVVLAAPHSKLRKDEDQTERMLAAVRHPGVNVLAHPRGRMYSRQGILARWDEVFAEASRHDVAIELDGDPYRQDLDFGLARRALEAGCRFAVDSDAHSGDQLRYAEIGLAHARLAGIPAERVINTWPAERLLEWAASKNGGSRWTRSAERNGSPPKNRQPRSRRSRIGRA